MRNKSRFSIFAITAFAVTLLSCGTSSTAENNNMGAIDAIMTRTSVRAYTSEKVSAEDIEIMLKAAMAAPTGSNRQPWQFIVVDDPEILKALSEINRGTRSSAAPLAIIACGDTSKEAGNWFLDVAAASENLLLAAHSLGLGGVWTGFYPENEEGRHAKLRELLNMPETTIPLNVMIIGHPSEPSTPKDKWDPAKVSYNKFGDSMPGL